MRNAVIFEFEFWILDFGLSEGADGLMDWWIGGVVEENDRARACKRLEEAHRVLTAAKNQRSGLKEVPNSEDGRERTKSNASNAFEEEED
jgi:hypothetical protein